MSDEKRPDMFVDDVQKPDLSPKVYESVPQEDPSAVEPVTDHVSVATGNIVDLPSKGMLGYPSAISYREIMAGDEEILKQATNKNFARTVNSVLKSICNDADFFDELYIGDRDFILTSIWGNTYDPKKQFQINCRHCNAEQDIEMNVFDIDTIDIKENFKPRFPLKVAKTGETIYIRLVTVRDDNNAETYLANNPKAEVSFEMVHIALAIEFGRPMSTDQRIRYIKENVSAREMGTIKEYHRYFMFGLDTSFEHTCSECQGVTHGQIPFLPEDIIAPRIQSDFEQLL